MKRKLPVILAMVLSLIVVGCVQIVPPVTTTQSTTATPEPSATPVPPTATPEPATPTAKPTLVPPVAAALSNESLAEFVLKQLYPGGSPDPDSYDQISRIGVLPLQTTGDQPLWLAYSLGFRRFDPLQNHFATIYIQANGEWQPLDRLLLDTDYINEGAVNQLVVESDRIWLEVQGGLGAHAGTYYLLSFNGQELAVALSNTYASPDAGWSQDLDGDGLPEIILNRSEPYVFCYACGLRWVSYQVWRWVGNDWVETSLAQLPDSAPAELHDLNNRAVDLAQGWLWKEAQLTIAQAAASAVDEPTVAWNKILIDMHAADLSQQMYPEGYPLLAHVLYGDYAAAVEVMRAYTPEEIFSPTSPLIVGTMAAGWEESLHDWIMRATDQALVVEPDLAAAYFLRAWAAYLADPADPQVLANVRQAAQLEPNEALYSQSGAFLETRTGTEDTSDQDRFVVAGLTEADVDIFLLRLQVSIAAGDVDGIANMVAYPIEVRLNGELTTLASKEDFVKNYAAIFDDAVMTTVLNQTTETLFANWQGVMVGDGLIWFGGVYADANNSGPAEILIIAINNQ